MGQVVLRHLPKDVVSVPAVVHLEVEDDRNAMLMRGIDQLLELIRRAIGGFNCVEEGWVVSPAEITRKFVDGHQLYCCDVQVIDVIVLPISVHLLGDALQWRQPNIPVGKAQRVELVN